MQAGTTRNQGVVDPAGRPPQAHLQLSCAHVAARALHVVADLGTADAIATEPRTADDLGCAGGADPDVLDRLTCPTVDATSPSSPAGLAARPR